MAATRRVPNAGRPERRLRVLVIDRMPPTSLRQGNALIGRNLFPRLRHHHLSLIAPCTASERDEAAATLGELFDEVHLVEVSSVPTAIGGWLDGALPSPIGQRRWGSAMRAATTRAATRAAATDRAANGAATAAFDVVHVRQLPMAPYGHLVPVTGRLLELIDAETLASRRDPRGGLRMALRKRLAREVERQAVRGYDVVTAVAGADAAALREIAPPATRVEVIPNGVDADWFAPLDLPEERDAIVFLGAMSFPPNVVAVTRFADAVLPRIRATRPAATFMVVGRDPTPAVRALENRPGIHVTGEVDDVRPYLARAAVVVCPMVSGSGIKNKVLEAMAMARPVVASPLAVEGIDIVPGVDVEVADGPAATSASVLRLLADPDERTRLGARARHVVEERYAWQACADRYDALYRSLAAPSPVGRELDRRAFADDAVTR